MRIYLYSLLALLPLLGLPLSATACSCNHAESTDSGIHTVPCCQEMPADCCVQQHQDQEPKPKVYMVAPQQDSSSAAPASISTLTGERAILRPQTGSFCNRARPPPLQASEHRCRIQSWLN